jgi:hypothetical protein
MPTGEAAPEGLVRSAPAQPQLMAGLEVPVVPSHSFLPLTISLFQVKSTHQAAVAVVAAVVPATIA